MIAVVRNLDAALDRGLQHRFALGYGDGLAVNRQRDAFHKPFIISPATPAKVARSFRLRRGSPPAPRTAAGTLSDIRLQGGNCGAVLWPKPPAGDGNGAPERIDLQWAPLRPTSPSKGGLDGRRTVFPVASGLAPVIEWMIAAGFLFATVGVASLVVREVRGPARVLAETPRRGRWSRRCPRRCRPRRVGAGPALPRWQGDPRRPDRGIRRHQSRTGRRERPPGIDRGTLGERLTRFYEYSGSRFIVVFEPFERNGEPRVAAIYLP